MFASLWSANVFLIDPVDAAPGPDPGGSEGIQAAQFRHRSDRTELLSVPVSRVESRDSRRAPTGFRVRESGLPREEMLVAVAQTKMEWNRTTLILTFRNNAFYFTSLALDTVPLSACACAASRTAPTRSRRASTSSALAGAVGCS